MIRPAGEMAVSDGRWRLIHAAAEAFRQEGYRASIDRIAQAAGVCRQTVYNNFANKEDLFSEVARIAAEEIQTSLDRGGGDVRESLLGFAAIVQQRVLSRESLAMFRTLSAEVPHFPALGQAFFDKGPGQTVDRLVAFLARAMEAGHLRRDDPQFAAELLMGMLMGFEHTRRLFCADAAETAVEPGRAERILDGFLRIYSL